MKIIGIVSLLVALAVNAVAITGNPTSNVLYNSAPTSGELVAYDGNSLFGLQTVTTTTLATAAYASPVGTVVLAQESVGGSLVSNSYNLCASTANSVASFVYIAVSTSAAAKAGAACSN